MPDTTDINPYAPPEARSTPETIARPLQQRVWLRRLCSLQMVVIVSSLAVEAYEHQSIVVSGMVFALVGLCISIVASRQHDTLAFVFGLSAIAFTGLIVFLINFNEWSPQQGDWPITILAFAYSLVALPLASFLVIRRSKGALGKTDHDSHH